MGDHPHMGRDMGILQNRVTHHLTERKLQRLYDGSWEYPFLEEIIDEEMWEVDLEVVEAYVLRRKNMVIQCYLLCTSVRNCFRGQGSGSINSHGNSRG